MNIVEVTRHWVGIGMQLTVRKVRAGKRAGVRSSCTADAGRCRDILVVRTLMLAAMVQLVSIMIFVTDSIVECIRPYEGWKHAEVLKNLKSRVRAMLFRAFVIGLPVILLAGCQGRGSVTSHKAQIPVRASVAINVLWPETVSVPATVSAVEVADMASRNGGWISQVNVVDGQHVTHFQSLVTVGLAAARYRLVAAESRLSVAKVNWSAASANEARYVFLVRTHATSGKRYDEVHSAFVAAKAELASARSALDDAKKDMDYADIRAPFSGTVVEKNVHRGAFVVAGTPLLKIVGGRPEIRAHVSTAVFHFLKLGQTSEVDIDGKSQTATTTFPTAFASPNAETMRIGCSLALLTRLPAALLMLAPRIAAATVVGLRRYSANRAVFSFTRIACCAAPCTQVLPTPDILLSCPKRCTPICRSEVGATLWLLSVTVTMGTSYRLSSCISGGDVPGGIRLRLLLIWL